MFTLIATLISSTLGATPIKACKVEAKSREMEKQKSANGSQERGSEVGSMFAEQDNLFSLLGST